MNKLFVVILVIGCLVGCRDMPNKKLEEFERQQEVMEKIEKLEKELYSDNENTQKVPDGKEDSVVVLKSLYECVEAIPDIKINNFSLRGNDTVQISFYAKDFGIAGIFDEKLREYFDFDRTFYNTNRNNFSLELKLKESEEKELKKANKEISDISEFKDIVKVFNEGLVLKNNFMKHDIDVVPDQKEFENNKIYSVRFSSLSGDWEQIENFLDYVSSNENSIQIKELSFERNKNNELFEGEIELLFYFTFNEQIEEFKHVLIDDLWQIKEVRTEIGEEVNLFDVFGSGIHLSRGSLKFFEDGRFENIPPGVYGEEDIDGSYSITEDGQVILDYDGKYKEVGKLSYGGESPTMLIFYNKYGEKCNYIFEPIER